MIILGATVWIFFSNLHLYGQVKSNEPESVAESRQYWKSPVTGKTYQLIFSDEFNGKNDEVGPFWSYRGEDWTHAKTRTVSYNNKKYGIMAVKSAVKQKDGNMELHVYKKTGTPDEIYTGGISTINSLRLQYGYFETRVNFSRCRQSWGHWPAFWVMYTFPDEESVPADYDMFSQGTELDIFEYISTNNRMHTNLNWRVKDTVSANPASRGLHDMKKHSWPLGAEAGWHVVALEWTPEEVIWYCDGKVKLRRKKNEGKKFVPSAFQYVCFSMSAGTWGGGGNVADPKNPLPARVQYDYCRVYQTAGQKAYYKLPETGNVWTLLHANERINFLTDDKN